MFAMSQLSSCSPPPTQPAGEMGERCAAEWAGVGAGEAGVCSGREPLTQQKRGGYGARISRHRFQARLAGKDRQKVPPRHVEE